MFVNYTCYVCQLHVLCLLTTLQSFEGEALTVAELPRKSVGFFPANLRIFPLTGNILIVPLQQQKDNTYIY